MRYMVLPFISAFLNVVTVYGHLDSPSVIKSEVLGWGAIEVSPNAFMSMEYQNFQVSVYKKEGSGNTSQQFFLFARAGSRPRPN
ncbi:hypothetical protein BV898_13767 [Hypsibius exemplaris]|uniref:Uncharacterized protein n=1 Tax=Hypsibius exemplaris TaxID=2072580 RepID=A0A1W0W9Y0_HYPEX|nr:hypothetical protein BV898_13767 [Hypsibius exemplaris]